MDVRSNIVNLVHVSEEIIQQHGVWSDILKKIPERILEYCKKNIKPLPSDVKLMNGQIAHYAIQVLKDTSRRTAYLIASMLVKNYPQLADTVKGIRIGKGHESLGMQIYNAINFRKDVKSKKRKASGPHPLFEMEKLSEENSKISRRQDNYGCVEYETNVSPTHLTELEEKRLRLFQLYSNPEEWSFQDISNMLNDLFDSLRLIINAENRCIFEVFLHCPFLGESNYLVQHASRVIYGKGGRSGKSLTDIWDENVTITEPALKQYCKSLYLLSESAKRKPKNSSVLKNINDLIAEAQAMCKKTCNKIPDLIYMFKIIAAFLEEDEDYLMKVIEVSKFPFSLFQFRLRMFYFIIM